jgi:hypothetical protein
MTAALWLMLAAPQSQAQLIKIGPGVQDPCYDGDNGGVPTADGWCDILGGSVNVILGDTLDVYLNSQTNVERMIAPLLLIFGVPVENLLFPFFGGNEFNGPVDGAAALTSPAKLVDEANLPCGPDCSAELAAALDVPVGFPSSPVAIDYSSVFSQLPNTFPVGFPGGFDQGQLFALGEIGASGEVKGNTNVYDFIGLPQGGGPNSNHINNWTSASQQIPALILGGDPEDFIAPSGWNLWVFTLDFGHGNFDAGDAIHAIYNELELPLGTWVVSWGIGERCGNGRNAPSTPNCDRNYFSMSMTESALLMPLPGNEIPEPASMFLLGTGLLAVGRQWRKRQARTERTNSPS